MTDYRAPLADIDFVLNRVCGLDRILQLPGFIDADSSMVRDLLEEAGRFMEDKVAPLNKVGDNFGVKLNADSTITTAPGLICAALMNSGLPNAAIKISACWHISSKFGVRECVNVTVQFP